MKKLLDKVKAAFVSEDQNKSLKIGSYSVTMTLIVIAIAIALNVLMTSLPVSWTKKDVTRNQMYSISYQTKKILQNLDEDTTIYWISQAKEENETLSILLDRYDSMTDQVTVVKRDPDIYPNFSQQYGGTADENNSLVVVSGDRYRYISYEDIFGSDSSSSSSTTSFAGESMITSAISYVTTDELPKMYLLEGHGELSLSDDLSEAIEKENIEVDTLSLLTNSEVPEDADAVMLMSPSSDISEIEKEALEAFAQKGGSLILVSDLPSDDEKYENLYALMSEYGMSLNEGIIIEADSERYAWGKPYYLLADIQSHTITDPLIEEKYYIMSITAQGITITNTTTAESLLNTSDQAYSKLDGYSITTYEKEENDIDGPFSLAAVGTLSSGSKALWLTSSSLLDDTVNSYVSGGNRNFFLNALDYVVERADSISIRTKTTTYTYLTMDDSTSTMYTAIVIAVIPLALIIAGAVIAYRRRRR